MKILELCLSPNLGGLELYVFRSAQALNSDEDVLSVINPTGKLKRYFDENGLKWTELKPGFKPLPLFTARKLAKIIDDNSIEVVHVHWGKDLPLAAFTKAMSKQKPRLVFTRQMQITRSKDDFYHNFIYENIDLTLAITQRLERDVRKFMADRYSNRVQTLYYGVKEPSEYINQEKKNKMREELNVPQDSFLAGIFGRIKHEKGQYLVIDAIKKLREQGKDVHGLIVGHAMETSYLENLKKEVEQSGLSSCIHFMDFVDNPQIWMQVCDVVILASYGETFGLVLAEAMQAGVAVIGTNDGGVPEIIEDGKTGLMFERGNSEGLAICIATLMENTDQRKVYAEAGKTKAKKLFDTESHFRKLREYLSAME